MKLHRQIFWLLVLLLPIQLGRHFWFEWSRVLGLPVDYLSPTVYLTDILVFLVLFFWFWQTKKKYSFVLIRRTFKNNWWLGAILLFLFVNACLAFNQEVAFFKLIKIMELALLGFYLVKNKYRLADIRVSLSLAIIYSSLIALFQFLKQASLGGLFWWLGERSFNLITPGIARAIIGGRLILRPYATFPHPNVLGGFLLVSLILVFGWQKEKKKFFSWLTLFLGGLALGLSFSRVVWFVSLLIVFGWWLRSRFNTTVSRRIPRRSTAWMSRRFAEGGLAIQAYRNLSAKPKYFLRESKETPSALRWGGFIQRKSLLVWLCFLILLSGLFYFLTLPLSGQETIRQRLALAQVAVAMIKTQPLAGVGLNNFISQLPSFWQPFGQTYWLQPVHNLFLLISAETGLVGLLIFIWFLILTFKRLFIRHRWPLLMALSVVLFLGLFDHYWLTLQPSQLLLSLIFGLSWRQ